LAHFLRRFWRTRQEFLTALPPSPFASQSLSSEPRVNCEKKRHYIILLTEWRKGNIAVGSDNKWTRIFRRLWLLYHQPGFLSQWWLAGWPGFDSRCLTTTVAPSLRSTQPTVQMTRNDPSSGIRRPDGEAERLCSVTIGL
jgi:hypothetical protein